MVQSLGINVAFLQPLMPFRNYIFPIILLLLFSTVKAQVGLDEFAGAVNDTSQSATDTAKRVDPGSLYATEILAGTDSFVTWDSTLLMIQRYNRLTRSGLPFVDLGTTASPQKILQIQHPDAGFVSGINPYVLYNKSPDSFKFYRAKTPLTRFFYTQGGNGVFILDALHTQNFSPGWNVTFDLSSIQNGELYTNSGQDHVHKAFSMGSHFESRNKRYVNQVILGWNRARRFENRGLLNDTFFYRPPDGNFRTEGRYIPATSTAASFYGKRHHRIEQQLRYNNTYLFHRIDWIREQYQYTESSNSFTSRDSAFYQGNALQNGSFFDSTAWNQWNNSLGVGGKKVLSVSGFWRMWYEYGLFDYFSKWKMSRNRYDNHSLNMDISKIRITGNLSLQGSAKLFLSGWNSGDHKEVFSLQYHPQKFSISVGIKNQLYRPVFISQRFAGNYIQTYQNLTQSSVNELNGTISYHSTALSIRATATGGVTKDYLYADNKGIFQQADRIRYAQLNALMRLKMGHFYIENTFSLQNHSREDIIPYPLYSGITGIYFQGPMFKKAMLARFGADIFYQTAFKSYAYNPMNAVFYPGDQNIGNYPFSDVYFSGEVKTVVFFLKLEHVNQPLTNYGFSNLYSTAQQYPGEPFRFRFGFTWRFYN